MLQVRFAELRADSAGRTLTGVAVRYGDVAQLPWGREAVAPGAFGDVGALDVMLNVQHSRDRALARTGGSGMELANVDDALTMRATLPNTRDADDTLALVRAGVLRGLSIEFYPTQERLQGDVLIVERADLVGLGVVDKPAYPEALVQARAALHAREGQIETKRAQRQVPWL